MEVYTPGSKAGTPVNILGSLSIPEDMDWESTQAETVRAEISGYTSGLLGLVDIDAHPLSSREHILISNLLEYRLSQGAPVDLPGLIHDIQDPPLRKLGVLDLDSFFPQKDRQSLALRLNGLLANPSFAPWLAGDPLDIDTLLHTSSGSPKASILYLSHLSAKERQFVVSLVLSKVATWMQTQTGTQNLRALVYIDEVYGFVPPTAAPPSKKPILTLLKQARAFGVGLVLSTQNPVDLDYKAMSNAGTWMVGRLQTERDKERILEALRSANGDADVSELSKRIGGLGKRQFLLYQTKSTTPKIFSTRWAMSYLAGPITKNRVKDLPNRGSAIAIESGATQSGTPPAEDSIGNTASGTTVGNKSNLQTTGHTINDTTKSELLSRHQVSAKGIPVYYADRGSPWIESVGGSPHSTTYAPALAARIELLHDDTKAKLRHQTEWETIVYPIQHSIDWDSAPQIDYDDRDFRKSPAEGAQYQVTDTPIDDKKWFSSITKDLVNSLYHKNVVQLFCHTEFKLYSRPGETLEQFSIRCHQFADDLADKKVEKLTSKLQKKISTLERRLETAETKLETAEINHSARKRQELLSGAASILGVLFGGRGGTKAVARRAARSASTGASQRSQSTRSGRRIVENKDKIELLEEQIFEIEQRLATDIEAISDEYTDKASNITEYPVTLEKNDIRVTEVAVVWLPV